MDAEIVVITGCLNGIGRDWTQKLTQTGYHVVDTARRLEVLSDLDVVHKRCLDITDAQSADVWGGL